MCIRDRCKRAELIERAGVEAEYAAAIVTVRNRLLRVPGEVRDRVDQQPGAVVEALLDREIRDILTGFSRGLNMGEADIEARWELWSEFVEWLKREKKGAVNGHA